MTEAKLKWIERVIYLVTILVGVIFYIRDEAVEKSVLQGDLVEMKGHQLEIISKLDKNDIYWKEQMEINGRVVMYIELDSNK